MKSTGDGCSCQASGQRGGGTVECVVLSDRFGKDIFPRKKGPFMGIAQHRPTFVRLPVLPGERRLHLSLLSGTFQAASPILPTTPFADPLFSQPRGRDTRPFLPRRESMRTMLPSPAPDPARTSQSPGSQFPPGALYYLARKLHTYARRKGTDMEPEQSFEGRHTTLSPYPLVPTISSGRPANA